MEQIKQLEFKNDLYQMKCTTPELILELITLVNKQKEELTPRSHDYIRTLTDRLTFFANDMENLGIELNEHQLMNKFKIMKESVMKIYDILQLYFTPQSY